LGIDQQPENLGERAFARARRAVKHQDRKWAHGPKCHGQPSHQSPEVGFSQVDERSEQPDRAVAAGERERQETIGAPEMDRRGIDDGPAFAIDLDSPATRIAEVEVRGCDIRLLLSADADET
jgi:hypothetical protein